MTNIINFNDKRKKQPEEQTPKEEMLKIIDSIKELIESDKLTGLAAVATGPENKVFSILAGEFDIIQTVGGLETVKHFLLTGSELGEDD